MISMRKLGGGGDIAVRNWMEMSSSAGIDLIELLMIPRSRGPYDAVFEIQGYDYPVGKVGGDLFDDNAAAYDWVDGTLKFYPDERFMCYGYVFDTPENRDKIASSLATGWYRIIDQRKREEIIAYAKEKGYRTEPHAVKAVTIRKSKREKEADDRTQNLEKKLFEAEQKLKLLQSQKVEVEKAKEKELTKRKLRGTKKAEDPNADTFDESSILETEK